MNGVHVSYSFISTKPFKSHFTSKKQYTLVCFAITVDVIIHGWFGIFRFLACANLLISWRANSSLQSRQLRSHITHLLRAVLHQCKIIAHTAASPLFSTNLQINQIVHYEDFHLNQWIQSRSLHESINSNAARNWWHHWPRVIMALPTK